MSDALRQKKNISISYCIIFSIIIFITCHKNKKKRENDNNDSSYKTPTSTHKISQFPICNKLPRTKQEVAKSPLQVSQSTSTILAPYTSFLSFLSHFTNATTFHKHICFISPIAKIVGGSDEDSVS